MRQAGVAANMPSSTKIDAVLETLDQIRGVRRCSCGKQKSALLEAAAGTCVSDNAAKEQHALCRPDRRHSCLRAGRPASPRKFGLSVPPLRFNCREDEAAEAAGTRQTTKTVVFSYFCDTRKLHPFTCVLCRRCWCCCARPRRAAWAEPDVRLPHHPHRRVAE